MDIISLFVERLQDYGMLLIVVFGLVVFAIVADWKGGTWK